MKYTSQQLREQRKMQNKEIQVKYSECKDYYSKLVFIFNTIITSQSEYLKYKGIDIFSSDYLQTLILELKSKENMNDLIFIELINERIIKPLNAGHVYIKPIEEIVPQEVLKLQEQYDKEHIDNNINIQCIDDTIIIKIKSFSKAHLKNDVQKFDLISKYLGENECNNVIFDIRGNTGGTDEYFEYFSMFSKSLKPIVITDKFRNMFSGENQSVSWVAMEGNSNGRDFNKYLLVDDKVFSTAEAFAMMCKKTGFATIIGEPTRGEGYGATPFTLQIFSPDLEYSIEKHGYTFQYKGAQLTFPVEAPINERGEIDYENYYRTIPDIICNSDEALSVALKQIELKILEKENASCSVL